MKEYEVVPFTEITDEARDIAAAWIDNYIPYGSPMPEIAQKHKLASDIMNYAKNHYRQQVIESVKKQWIKDFGPLNSESPLTTGYSIIGFINSALK